MKKIQVNINSVLSTVSEKDIHALETSTAADALEKLREGTGEGNDFLGWLDLPSRTPMHHLDEIIAVANDLRNSCDYVVSVGPEYKLIQKAHADKITNSNE